MELGISLSGWCERLKESPAQCCDSGRRRGVQRYGGAENSDRNAFLEKALALCCRSGCQTFGERLSSGRGCACHDRKGSAGASGTGADRRDLCAFGFNRLAIGFHYEIAGFGNQRV